LLWHAPQEVITAGGFRRTYEILRRAPSAVRILAVDDRPSFLADIRKDNLELVEYRIPRPIRALEQRFFYLSRILEWASAALLMCLEVLRRHRRGESFDTVFVPSSEQLPALLAGVFAKRLLGAELIACNMNIDIFSGPLQRLVARMHDPVDRVIAISEHLAGTLRDRGVRSPVFVNGVGLDLGLIERFTAGVAQGDKEYDAVFVGRHDASKGVFELLEIWKAVVDRSPGARLAMIGSCNPGNRKKIEGLLSGLGLGGSVDLMGTVPDVEKYSVMKRSGVCLFPSHVEEWGIVPQEALACGLPVVAYDLPVYRENIADCPAVFLVRKGDVHGMAEKTLGLLAGSRYADYASVGPGFVERFGWDSVAEREFEIICGGSTGGAAGRGE